MVFCSSVIGAGAAGFLAAVLVVRAAVLVAEAVLLGAEAVCAVSNKLAAMADRKETTVIRRT